jgi:hypothetical protein
MRSLQASLLATNFLNAGSCYRVPMNGHRKWSMSVMFKCALKYAILPASHGEQQVVGVSALPQCSPEFQVS